MGWMYQYKNPKQPASAWIREHFTNIDKDGLEVLDVAVVKLRTAYTAIKQHKTGEVFACVFLLGFAPADQFNFGYKDVEESMGPCESECPERILKLLTPTTSEYAQQWRERCWARINARKQKPKVSNGCTIKLAKPIKFSDGASLDIFKVERRRGRTVYRNGYSNYRIGDIRNYDYTVIACAYPRTGA